MAGERAYKIKKPLRYPFVDQSTLERRRRLCEEEVRLNRRLAPDIYRGVVPITADLRVSGEGEAVEYAVEMVALPADRMLDVLLAAESVDRRDVERIADRIAEFHAHATVVRDRGGPDRERVRARRNLDAARQFLPAAWHARLAREHDRLIDRLADLMERRIASGFVRDGHGDLHAENICLPSNGEVVIYDCLEFAEALRCGDVAGEIAFLAMDLERRGAPALAEAFVARYVARTGDRDALRLLPLFKLHRACVRGLVGNLRDPPREDARSYFRLAVSYALGPFVVLTCGLPGTGKSYLAARAAREFNADLLRSDLVRKELYGIPPTQRWDGGFHEGPYDPALTQATYAALHDRAAAALAAGRPVVVDATFSRGEQRDRFRALGHAAPTALVHVECAEDLVRVRMEARAGDARTISDADFAVYRQARGTFESPLLADFVHDGAGPPEPALDGLLDALLRA